MSIDEYRGGAVGDVRVDFGEVYRISDTVLDTAGRLARMADGIYSWESTAAGAIEGSATCSPLAREVAAFWRHALEGVAEEVRGFGADLRATADSYGTSDDAARIRIQRAGG